MKIKKFLLSLIFIISLSVSSAYGATEFLITSGAVDTDLYTTSVDDATGEDIYTLNELSQYKFTTIQRALSFANDPQVYLGKTLTNPTTFPDISITLEKDETLSDVITFGDYGSVSSVSFSGTYTLTNAENKRHFVVNKSGITLTFNNQTFAGKSGGGVQIDTGGTTTFNNITFQNIDASVNSDSSQQNGAVYVDSSGGAVNFSGSTFSGNKGTNGGALYVSGGTVTISGTGKFSSNTATSNGGAVYIESGTVIFTGTNTFDTANNATNGGAVYIAGGNTQFGGTSKFSANKATGDGGAIYIENGTATFTDTNTFDSINTAANGGAIYMAAGTVSFAGTNKFSSNTATTAGGALYAASGAVTFSEKNDFSGNTAPNGGALYIATSEGVTLNGTPNFTSNMATTNGGAIFITGSGLATMGGTVTFTSNKASGSGGAVYVEGSGRIANNNSTLIFSTNTAGDYSSLTTDPTSGGSPTTGFGGAICFAGSGTSALGTVKFDGNNAQAGGAIASTGSGRVGISGEASFGAETENMAWVGGAVYIARGGLNFNGVTDFQNNTALDSGGAVYTTANGSLKFAATTTFTKNQANTDNLDVGDGGAVYWGGKGSDFKTAFTVASSDAGVTFSQNQTLGGATTVTNKAGSGGAVYFAGTDTLLIDADTNINFTNNIAYNSGGAIAADSGSVTLEDITVSEVNTATNGGGGLVYSASGTVTVNNSTVQKQNAVDGGAVYALVIDITSSSFDNNGDASLNQRGGALYSPAGGTLTINSSVLSGNKTSRSGGAVYADTSTVNITDTYFLNNSALIRGGALDLEGSTTTVTKSTFETNEAQYGGAIQVFGSIQINTSYFKGNRSSQNGGGIYFSQYGTGNSSFSIKSSMLEGNVADGGQGGGAFIEADSATVDSCTFYSNNAMGGTDAKGGGLYLDVSNGTSSTQTLVDNCTFFENQANNGSSSSSGGGMTALGNIPIRSSAFLKNTAITQGGGVCVEAGTVEISGTLIVGNNAPSDIYARVNEEIRSGGYNRIGIYETVQGRTGWKAGPGATGDESDTTWTMATFYSDNTLADNEVSNTIPPYIGSKLADTNLRLKTIMLNEDENLSLTYTAINIIPYRSARFRFSQYDQRGVDRRAPGTDLDIGPVFFGSVERTSDDTTQYEISYVTISGVPNSMRRIGQTASLTAKIYYTNRRTAYAGTGANDEAVTWSVSPTGFLTVDENGVITARRVTTGQTYVTVTAKTQRSNTSGEYPSDSARIKIDPEYTFGDLNNSPLSGNSDALLMLRELRYNFEEYNLGYGLVDKNLDIVQTDIFQTIYNTIWGTSAAVVSSFTGSEFNLNTVYSASDGFTPSKGAGFTVSFTGVNTGEMFPVVFPWEFSGDELKTALGSQIYSSVSGDLSIAHKYGVPLSYLTAEEIFNSLRLEFQGKYSSMPIIGNNSAINISEAIDCGALELLPADEGKGLLIKLTAYIANVNANNFNGAVYPAVSSNQARIINKLLVVPDGSADGEIYGTMWLAQKYASSTTTTTTQTTNTKNKTSDTKSSTGSESSSSGSGGGGCVSIRGEELGVRSLLLFLLLMLGLCVNFKKAKK